MRLLRRSHTTTSSWDRHEVVVANGALTESLYPGPQALKSMGAMARLEVLALYPKMTRAMEKLDLARPVPEKGRMAKQLVMRHIRNNKPLISDAYEGISFKSSSSARMESVTP
jgi:hypothetical protein